MRKHVGISAIAVAVLSLLVNPRDEAAAQSPPPVTLLPPGLSQLKVDPYEGHAGDALYLSGHNFLPHIRLLIYRACPNWHAPDAYRLGNIGYELSRPETDSRGDFAGIPLDKLSLNGVESAPCTFYASYPPDPRLPDTTSRRLGLSFFNIEELPAIYYVERGATPLPESVTRIRAHITTRPLYSKTGFFELITIDQGWGGAHAAVTVRFPRARQPITVPTTLDWNGHALLRIAVPKGTPASAKANISVRFRLGSGTGTAHSSFVVVH